MMRPLRVAPGESAVARFRLELQIYESRHRPQPEKTQHRISPITADCIDCGRGLAWIVLNEYAPCFEVTR